MAVEGSNRSKPVSVFEKTSLSVENILFRTSKEENARLLPKELRVVTPSEAGKYPVLVFVHGTCLCTSCYSQLFEHVASHGYIVVAPQMPSSQMPCCLLQVPWLLIQCCTRRCDEQVELIGEVTKWLTSNGLDKVLANLDGVEANLDKVALSGHSKGGLMAFAYQLEAFKNQPTSTSISEEESLKYSALIGIDPVAFPANIEPNILTNESCSFNLGIPVSVIGTGLGEEKILGQACAPVGLNHAQFFDESKPPRCYFVAKDYGHMDMLNDGSINCICVSPSDQVKNPKCKMRLCIGGLVVAFMNDYLKGDASDLQAIFNNPEISGITLDPVKNELYPVTS